MRRRILGRRRRIGFPTGRGVAAIILVATATVVVVGAPPAAALSNRAYVPVFDSGGLAVIDTATGTVIASVAVGEFPVDVDLSPDGARAYVSDYQAGFVPSVAVVDTATNTHVANVVFATRSTRPIWRSPRTARGCMRAT